MPLKMFYWRTCNIGVLSVLPELAKSQKAVNELSCSCQYFWSLLAYQHMFDTSRPHQHPPSIYQFCVLPAPFLKAFTQQPKARFYSQCVAIQHFNSCLFMVIDLFYLRREWVSVCLSVLSPSCPFVKKRAINLPGG